MVAISRVENGSVIESDNGGVIESGNGSVIESGNGSVIECSRWKQSVFAHTTKYANCGLRIADCGLQYPQAKNNHTTHHLQNKRD